MSRVVMKKPEKMKDPPQKSVAKVNLDESSEEEEEDPALSQEPVAAAVLQLTKIVAKMSATKKNDPLEDSMDFSGSAGGSVEASGGLARKHAAVIRALKRTFKEEPKKLWMAMEANLMEDYSLSTVLPNSGAVGFSARGWAEHRSKIQGYPRTARAAWAVAGIYDALRCNSVDEAKTRCLLLLAQFEQESLDRGSFVLAQEFSLEPSCPISSSTSAQRPCGSPAIHGRDSAVEVAAVDPGAPKIDSLANPFDLAEAILNGAPAAIPDSRNVPGYNASSIDIDKMWSKWPSLIYAGNSKFCEFFRAQCNKPQRAKSSGPTSSLWPMPLPFWKADFRAEACEVYTASLKKLVNLQVSYLNFLYLGSPKSPPDEVCGSSKLNARQLEAVERFLRLSKGWSQHELITADTLGRTAAKQERQEEILGALQTFSSNVVGGLRKYGKTSHRVQTAKVYDDDRLGHVVGFIPQDGGCVAQSIIASRIKMEGKPEFNPEPFLDPVSRKLYTEPFHQSIDPCDLPEPPPRVRVHATLKEKLDLLALLHDSGRLVFRSAKEIVPMHGNGLFCVPKNLTTDRLILDGRPANMLQDSPNNFIYTMGSANVLTGLHLEAGQKLLMSGDDLSNFFYMFRVNYDRATRNYLDWKIPTHLVKHFPNFPKELLNDSFVYGCLSSLAMGDSAACEYAQTSHLAMGIQGGAIDPKSLVTLHGRLPRHDLITGIIIDDYILMQKVDSETLVGDEMDACRSKMHSQYTRVKLSAHPSKGFSNEVQASFWGADVDGEEGLVRGNVSRAASLCWVTSQLVDLGVCTVGLLEIVAGGFVALFGFRRRLMSLLDLVYAAQGGRRQGDVIAMSGALRDELLSLCLLCPLAVSDLRTSFGDDVWMVDSSNWGDAVCKAPLRGHMKQEIHRHGLVKSAWTRLLAPFKARQRGIGNLDPNDELPNPDECFTNHPVWEVAARAHDFSLVWKRRAKKARHINIGELRSYLKAEQLAGLSTSDIRVAIGGDSQVTAGAICKGRSASHALNRELRQSLPHVLGLGIYSSCGYTKTQHNPADDPTRGKRVRESDIAFPEWWLKAEEGSFEDLDFFLETCNLGDATLGGYPPLQQLFPHDHSLVDPVCKANHNSFHRKLERKLKSRHDAKPLEKFESVKAHANDHVPHTTFSEHAPPWTDDVQAELESFGEDLFIFGEGFSWPPRCPGFLDLYSGRKGFARSVCRQGAPWVLTVDIADGPQADLLNSGVRMKLERLLLLGVFIYLSAAPICASFSRAITPAVRSREEPEGIQPVRSGMVDKIKDGNSHGRWLCKMLRICLRLRIHYWIENPDGSFIWLQPSMTSLPRRVQCKFYKCDFCHFGTPWRKRTRFLTSSRLAGLRHLCDRTHKHRVLRGRGRGQKASWTKIAEPYPKKLCSLLAWAAVTDLKISNRSKPLDSLCCRSNRRRIGEAGNPGPRARRFGPRPPGQLDSVELIRPETQALGHKQWANFSAWAELELGSEAASSLWSCPALLGHMLAAYGRHCFEIGGALFNYRHLVVFAQREFTGARGNLQAAWDTITRWEELEPVEHRRPVPLALYQAMVSLALLWGWTRVACVLLISFNGCCRPGEVLRACRGQLVLPEDLGQSSGPIFFRINKPKPGRRGMGRVQHTKINCEISCSFLSRCLRSCHPDVMIFGGSPGVFRTRWNKLLLGLCVPTSAGITPAGLRAGGTVHLYRSGLPIADILWALRLKNIETLQHYLQEVATQITMVDLPQHCKDLVKSFSICFPHFLSILLH
eukprot:Skav200074  [mRNA]  locus=scaffold838:451933:457558:- [translate_table: standard]